MAKNEMPSSDFDTQPRKRLQLDPKILPSITSLLTFGMIALGLKGEMAGAIALAAANLIVAALQYRKCHKAETGVKRAEASVPGITTPNGPIAPVTVIKNDSTIPGPPTVTHPTSNEGEHI